VQTQAKPQPSKANSLGIKRLERRIDTAKLAVGNAGSVHGETGVRHGCWQCCLGEWGLCETSNEKDKRATKRSNATAKQTKNSVDDGSCWCRSKRELRQALVGVLLFRVPSAPRMTPRRLIQFLR
jgi:hypothetical protein